MERLMELQDDEAKELFEEYIEERDSETPDTDSDINNNNQS